MDAGEKKTPGWLRTILIGRNPKFTFVRIVVVVALIFVVRAYVLLPVRVRGESMMPTFQPNGVNFVNRLAYVKHNPQRGDIVAIRYSDEHVMMLKRILGVPGDTVAMHNGQMIVNGEPLAEPYVKFPGHWEMPSEILGTNEYFVIGDNRAVTVFGRADRKRIVGKILLWKNLFASSSQSS